MTRFLSARLALSALVLLCAPAPRGAPAAEPASAEPARGVPAGEWSLLGRTPEQHHYSPLTAINEHTVSSLGVAWATELPTTDGLLANPLVWNGLVYEIGAFSRVWALDVHDGHIVWSYDPKVEVASAFPSMWSHHLNRGVALLDGRVFFGTSDCRLIALDARSGRLLWQVQACDRDGNRAINGAPRVGGGKVFIGNSDVDTGIGRGSMDAFDARTGRHLWRFYTLPGDPALAENRTRANQIAAATWPGGWQKAGGGSTWEGITYDALLNRVYFGVDGPSPWNARDRRGDNLFTDSVVAVDADTGEYLWHYQTVPNDSWDFNDCSPIVIAELPIGGKMRRVLLHAPKNGFFYVLDPKSGALISADKIGAVTWATRIDPASGRPVEIPAARYYATREQRALVNPGPVGVHNWHAMSYDEQTHLIYIPITDVAVRYAMLSQPGLLGGDTLTDYYAGMSKPGERAMGALLAWDPSARRAAWKRPLTLGTNGGVLSTAGNLVVQGTATGDLIAYRATDGKTLWSLATGSAIQGAPSTVEVDGEQLILVSVGQGGGIGLSVPRYSADARAALGPSRLIALKIGGTVHLPPSPAPTPFTQPPLPRPDSALASRGELLFSEYACDYCHGPRAERLGMSVPDLRRASRATLEGMQKIVVEGALAGAGMPAFHEMPAADLEAIRAFVLSAAWKAFDGSTGVSAGGSTGGSTGGSAEGSAQPGH